MISCEVRAEQLASRIQNGTVRERVRAELSQFFGELDEIAEAGERSTAYAEKNDGTPVVRRTELDAREQHRIDKLKEENFFAPSSVLFVPADEDDIDARGQFGYTKLIRAVVDHDTAMVVELLDQGANPHIKDNSGSTAYDKAINRGYEDIVTLLQQIVV